MIPSPVLLSTPAATPFGFEWEATPLLYSFGMTKLVSPWYSFLVEPPARFTGSIELVVSGQIFTTKVGTSYFGGSAQLLGHIPLIEKGEHLGLNIGVAQYSYSDARPFFKAGGGRRDALPDLSIWLLPRADASRSGASAQSPGRFLPHSSLILPAADVANSPVRGAPAYQCSQVQKKATAGGRLPIAQCST